MESVKRFNGLNGTVATRAEILALIEKAIADEQFHISQKLTNLLIYNSNDTFKFEILNPANENVPLSMLDCFQLDDILEDNGLNKAVSADEIYQTITDKIINTIKEVGHLPWQKGWKGTGLPTARNYVSEQPYTGINAMILPYEEKEINGKLTIVEPKTQDVYYLTFNQIESLGAKLKKGSKGRMVTYFNFVYNYSDGEKKINTTSAEKLAEFVRNNNIDKSNLDQNLSRYPVLKYYVVFNADDCENLPKKQPKKANAEPNEIAEKIIELYPNSPKIVIGKDERAFYRPSEDKVYMPTIKAFEKPDYYYSTFFHELIHSTGSQKRLDRDMSGRFGNAEYAFEELIAELGAVFMCAESGILFQIIENSAKYLKGWNSKLVGKLEEDNKFFFRAAAAAQKGANYILDYNDKREAAYFRYFKNNPIVKEIEVEKPKKAIKIKQNPSVKKEVAEKAKKAVKAVKAKKEIIETPVAEEKPVKVDANGQTSLFGVKKSKLNAPGPTVIPNIKTIGKIKSIADTGKEESEFFKVNGEVGKFLQQVERKPFESVVITMDGMQGAGKTTTLYKFIDAFASAGNSSLFISGEEHPESSLAVEKRDEYLSSEAKKHTAIVGDVESVEQLYQYVKPYDIIFIDSWQKLQRMVGNIRLDEDLRKKFNGKVFVVICQQTTTGRTKGGAEVVFDGDIIIKMVKEASFADNYAYFDKNRYTKIPIENIRYNIASGTIYNPNEPEPIEEPIAKLINSGLGFVFQT